MPERASQSEPSRIYALVEVVSEWDLFLVVSREQPNLYSPERTKKAVKQSSECGLLESGTHLAKEPRQGTCSVRPSGETWFPGGRAEQRSVRFAPAFREVRCDLRTEKADFVPFPVVLHEIPVPSQDMFMEIPGSGQASA